MKKYGKPELSVLITGGTSGLGLELSRYFMAEGYRVYILGRRLPDSLKESDACRFINIDLSDIRLTASVIRNLSGEMEPIDILVNNAGVLSPPVYTTSSDGIEYTFQVNWLSHLIINEILIREGKVSPGAKIVSVTSPVYKYVKPGFRIHGPDNYSGFRAYAESKYYMLLTGRYLKRVFPHSDFIFFSFNPGTFRSGIARMQTAWFRQLYKIGSPFLRPAAKPALNLIEILKHDGIINEAVYTTTRRWRGQETVLKGTVHNHFIDETVQLTSRFVVPDSEEASVDAV